MGPRDLVANRQVSQVALASRKGRKGEQRGEGRGGGKGPSRKTWSHL